MPEVIQIRPKGIYVNIEFSMEELAMLKKGFDMIQINADLKDTEQFKVNDYIINKFYPFIRDIVKDLEHGT